MKLVLRDLQVPQGHLDKMVLPVLMVVLELKDHEESVDEMVITLMAMLD